MALYLVQHGHTLDKEDDPERGLCDQGVEEVMFVAEVARSRGIRISEVFHSGKKRSLQTARIFWEELLPTGNLAVMEALASDSDVEQFAANLDPSKDQMFVGHLPFMERLVSLLITGSIEKTVVRFQKGGIVCLDRLPNNGPWYIRWTLFPGL